MLYQSTRKSNVKEEDKKTSSYVIMNGIASDGGLFVPESFPEISMDFLKELCEDDYSERAVKVLSLFLTDYSAESLKKASEKAYSQDRFEESPTCLSIVGDLSILELWHGPTSAFKDMALQIMPLLLSEAIKMQGEKNDALILVATSGDTGKAALEGYANADRVKIAVFYPCDGVSEIQKLQMASQEGDNVYVMAVKGNFDDCQSGVKAIFANDELRKEMTQKGYFFSSANSINWGRLAPQIVYYISAYCDMVNSEEIKLGDEINVTVPTGNFGNILAAYIAKKMGMPFKKLICASNKNKVLTDFFETGVYDKNREFYLTSSPSMDILISSNLERLLYFTLGGEKCRELMSDLSRDGKFSVDKDTLEILKKDFDAYYCDEEQTKKAIGEIFLRYGYLADTHTAVGIYAAKKYLEKDPSTKMLTVSTASPFKFSASVIEALGLLPPENGIEALEMLADVSNMSAPKRLAELKTKSVRFNKVINASEMPDFVRNIIQYFSV